MYVCDIMHKFRHVTYLDEVKIYNHFFYEGTTSFKCKAQIHQRGFNHPTDC